MKRFRYFKNSQMIKDSLTGYTYVGDEETCELMNRLSERGDKILESFMTEEILKLKWQKDIYKNFSDEALRVLNKYEIKSLEKLDQMLMEQRVW